MLIQGSWRRARVVRVWMPDANELPMFAHATNGEIDSAPDETSWSGSGDRDDCRGTSHAPGLAVRLSPLDDEADFLIRLPRTTRPTLSRRLLYGTKLFICPI